MTDRSAPAPAKPAPPSRRLRPREPGPHWSLRQAYGSSQQGGDVARREEPGALAIARAAVAAKDEGAKPERPEQEQAGALGFLRAAVLRHEAEDPAQVLDVEPTAV